MILELVESDRPKSLGEKISTYLARPPLPVLRFYKDFKTEVADGRKHILFAVRNGLPLPLLYGVYAEAKHDTFTDYTEKTDHIGPFGVDDWRLTIDTVEPVQANIRVGLVPFEILTDRVEVAI